MASLVDEHTSNRHGKPIGREYLWFASVLIALLLIAGVQIGLSRTDAGAVPLDPVETTPAPRQ